LGTPDAAWKEIPESYIAKYDINTMTVVDTIRFPGGPEGLAISNGKLYAALNYKDSVAVINLTSKAVSYIATPTVSSYFIKDATGNLYVSLVSYDETKTALGYINTISDQLVSTYPLNGISTEYASVIAANADCSKIYVAKATYKQKGSVYVFDTNTRTYNSAIITDISGLKGLTVNPKTGDLYVLSAESTTASGLLRIYDAIGNFKSEKATGAYPTMAIFQD
jgi:DNA-binding beta-propeller fold protein YncE